MDFQQALARWATLQAEIAAKKEEEQTLRKFIIETAPFKWDGKETGSATLPLSGGYELKATRKLTYSLDDEKIDSALDKIASMGEYGKVLSERLVKWKGTLSMTEYKNLQNQQVKAIIDSVITVKPAMPVLELVAPKTTAAAKMATA